MQISIQNTWQIDAADIFALNDDAIAYQKEIGNHHWLDLSRHLSRSRLPKTGITKS